MADETSRNAKDSANVETDKNYAQAYHDRRKDEPAAAPLETDAEAGGREAGAVPSAETRDRDSRGSNDKTQSPSDSSDHRDAPWVQEEAQHRPRLSRSLVIGMTVIILLIIVIAV
ncbi:hypothetical protein [Yoonia sp.]|uniref:hypothetical protein n=1 Tax=Yoonia sp. TaxID=2212373 RepID=UPI00358E44B5